MLFKNVTTVNCLGNSYFIQKKKSFTLTSRVTIIFSSLNDSIKLLKKAIKQFRNKTIDSSNIALEMNVIIDLI